VALAATVLLAAALGGGAWLWVKTDHDTRQAQVTREVNDALNRATALREQARASPAGGAALFARAREQAQRALALAEHGPADEALKEQARALGAKLDEEEKDSRLLAALDEAFLAQAETVTGENRFASERAVPKFREAFQDYGLPAGKGEPAAVAARIRERPAPVREALVAALAEWYPLAADPRNATPEPHLEWLRAVALAAEPQDGWTRRLWVARGEEDVAKRRATLEQLAAEADVTRVPARTLTHLADRLLDVQAGANAVRLLRRAREQYPGDFWVNHALGMSLRAVKPPERAEAVRFLTAAVALRPLSPGANLNLGHVLLENGQVEEAITCFKKARALDPNYAAAHDGLGMALSDQGQLDEAIACYVKAIALSPKDVFAHHNLGNALYRKGQVDAAIAAFRKAVAFGPKQAVHHINLGLALADKGQLDAAITCLEKAIALDPENANAHSSLGNTLRKKGRLDAATAYFKKASALDPNFAQPHAGLGLVHLAEGRPDEAIACYEKAIALDPKAPGPHNNLGTVLRSRGRLLEAIACFEKAIALDPKDVAAHTNLASALHALGLVDEAIALYHEASALDPKLATIPYNLASAFKSKGLLDEAIASYEKAIALDPNYAAAHNNLGLTLAAKRQWDEAIDHYRKAIAIDPKHAFAYHNLGLALRKKGQLDDAIAHFRKAVEIDPNYVLALGNLGIALYDRGRVDEAIDCYQKVIALAPKDAIAYAGVGRALEAKGRVDEAIRYYQKAIALNPRFTMPLNNLGALLCDVKKDYDGAIHCFRQVIALNPKNAMAHTNLGNALSRKGQWDEALASYQQAVAVDPKYVYAHGALGTALLQRGRFTEGRDALHEALRRAPPGHPYRKTVQQQLQRCEQLLMVDRKINTYLEKWEAPGQPKELLEMIDVCRVLKRYHATAADLYALAFTALPALAEDPKYVHRYNAACCAALAAAGQGDDAAKLDEQARTRLRQQALAWLRADLARWAKRLDSGTPVARTLVQQRMRHWQQDPDLIGIRDAAALAKLPETERQEFTQLWRDVATLLKNCEAKGQ
jgi:tetratricopeptide (TPR) repeat protein